MAAIIKAPDPEVALAQRWQQLQAQKKALEQAQKALEEEVLQLYPDLRDTPVNLTRGRFRVQVRAKLDVDQAKARAYLAAHPDTADFFRLSVSLGDYAHLPKARFATLGATKPALSLVEVPD